MLRRKTKKQLHEREGGNFTNVKGIGQNMIRTGFTNVKGIESRETMPQGLITLCRRGLP
jgi:hypothetical protein